MGVLLGILIPDLAAITRPYFPQAIFVMLTLALIRVDVGLAVAWAKRPVPILLCVVWLLIVCPLLAAVVLKSLGGALPPALVGGLILYAASPPILSSVNLALLLRLEASFAMVVMLTATLISPLTVPPLALWLAGVDLDISTAGLMLQLGLFVLCATVVAAVSRRALGAERRARYAAEIDGLMVVFLLLFACAIMDGVTALLFQEPLKIAGIAALAFGVNLLMQAATLPLLRWGKGEVGPTLMMMSGNKNMGLLVAALGGLVDPLIFLFFALAQLPIYTLPSLMQPIYNRFARR